MGVELPDTPQQEQLQVADDEEYRRLRLPSDLLRLLAAIVVGAVGFALASFLDNISVGITIEVIDAFDGLPAAMVVTFILAVQLLAWLVPIVTLGLLLLWHRYRRLLLVVLSVVVACALGWGLQSEVTSRFAAPTLEVEPPAWVCDDLETRADDAVGADSPSTVEDVVTQPGETIGTVFGSRACVPGDGFPSIVYLAGLAAGFSTLTPWLNGRWRRAGWIILAVFLIVRLIDGLLVPVDALLIVAVGYAVGAGVLLAFGSPDRRPRSRDVAAALSANGFPVTYVRPAQVQATDSVPFVAETSDGRRLFVKVRSPEERAAEILYRMYRTLRLTGFGDERPLMSLRREVEHEAATSLTAFSAGVRTPRLLRVAPVGSTSLLLAFDEIAGTSLDGADDSITDDELRSLWEQVALLHGAAVAHRNLSPGNLMIDAAGHGWLLDFGFAEMSPRPADLNGDVAQLLATLALQVGAERAVNAAVAVLGPDAVARAAPRLQPTALSSSTRTALKRQKGLLDDIHTELQTATGAEEYELEKLERVKPRTVLTAVMLGLAFYVLIPMLADVDLSEIGDADWRWVPLVVFFSFLTYVGASVALMGSIPERLSFWPTFFAQMAASFFNRIVPVKVGGMAANVRYLQKNGVDPSVAIAGVGVNNIGGVIVHVSLLAIFGATVGRSATDAFSPQASQAVLLGLVVVLTLAGGIMLLPWGRRFFLGKLIPVLKKAGAGMAAVAVSPKRLSMLFGGGFVITMSYAFALWYSLEAFGGGLGFVTVTAVYLGMSAVEKAAPTPGGIGGAEAAMIAGLTAFGVDPGVAVPAVFLYRIATFWLPILPGWLAYKRLAAKGAF